MNTKNPKTVANLSNNLEKVSKNDSQYFAQQRRKNELVRKYGTYQLVQLDCVADYLKENGL